MGNFLLNKSWYLHHIRQIISLVQTVKKMTRNATSMALLTSRAFMREFMFAVKQNKA